MAWIGAVVAAAGAIGGAIAKGDAARKAANARLEAVRAMEDIVTADENQLARTADTERFAGQLALQKELDPTVAKIREAGAQGVLASLDTSQDANARALADKLASENLEPDKGLEALKTKLLADAQADLDRGAQLDPAFQSELVRSGLESAGASGFKAAPSGGAARSARSMLGAAGIALKEQRRKAATETAGAVSDLQTARANILGRIIPTLTSLGDATAARAGKAFGMANEAMPEYGLSGTEMVNLDLARINQQNKKMGLIGGLNAEKAIAQGQMYSEMIGAGANAVGSIVGGLNLGGAGAGAGAGAIGSAAAKGSYSGATNFWS